MTVTQLAAIAYGLATAVVVGFQIALAAGAPWGAFAMGGRFPGRFPPALRAAALVQAVVLACLAMVVLDRAGVVALGWTTALPWLAWVPVVVSAVSLAMNAASRSVVERRTWVPVAFVMTVTSLGVALTAA